MQGPRTGTPATPWLRLALAAGLVAVLAWWWQDTTRPRPAPAPSAHEPIEAPARHAVLAELARVTPPRYVPPARRSAPPAGSFDAAMVDYAAGRLAEAAAALALLSEAKPTDPGIAFFWGISALAIGRTDDAREGLTRAIAADVQPYEDEAHFYLAKVYLGEGAIDLARLELQYAVDHQAGPDGEARRILDALDRLPR